MIKLYKKVIKVATVLLFIFILSSCDKNKNVVVVYTALDSNFSRPIFDRFTKKTGIKVLAKFDVESTKTIGLFNTIIAEAKHPRCDVFWNNEILNTIRLKNRGLLQTCSPSNSVFYAEKFKDKDKMWFGFAARARVIIINTNLLAKDDFPKTIFDLCDVRYKNKIGIAKTLFGTTATHITCLFSKLGKTKARNFLFELKKNNVAILSGNKQCAVDVANGKLFAALTDTDDAFIELKKGASVKIIFPDQKENEIGTLIIPNTLALIRNCPHKKNGEKLINFLLSPKIEEELAQSLSAQIPLNKTFKNSHSLGSLSQNFMEINFNQAASEFESTAQWLRKFIL